MTRPEAIRRTREMWAGGQGGWTISDIRQYLADRGQPAAWETVKGWADPAWAARRREQQRAQQRRWWRKKHGVTTYRVADMPSTDTERLERLAELRQCGVSYTALARIATAQFGDPITAEQVRYALKADRYPRFEAAA